MITVVTILNTVWKFATWCAGVPENSAIHDNNGVAEHIIKKKIVPTKLNKTWNVAIRLEFLHPVTDARTAVIQVPIF